MNTTKRQKLAQDRVVLLHTYDVMVRVLRVRRRDRVSRAEFAAMGVEQITRVCHDLYDGAPIRLANRLARMAMPKEPLTRRVKLSLQGLVARVWLKAFHLKMWAKRRRSVRGAT